MLGRFTYRLGRYAVHCFPINLVILTVTNYNTTRALFESIGARSPKNTDKITLGEPLRAKYYGIFRMTENTIL